MITLQQTFFKRTACLLLAAFVFLSSFTLSLQNSYSATATEYGVGRTRTCNSQGDPEGLNFDPTTAGKDAEFVMGNPVCLTVALTSYALVKGAITYMNSKCGSGGVPSVMPQPITDSISMVRAGVRAVSDNACAAAFGGAVAAWGQMIGQLGIIYAIADVAYQKTEVCGSDWISPDARAYDISAPDYKKTVDDAMEGYIRNGTAGQLSLSLSNDSAQNKTYREWYYGGKEVEDNPASGDACYDVTQKVNGSFPKQRYYMKGTAAGNFNCKKYDMVPGNNDPLTGQPVTLARVAELQAAYNCCKNRSASYICIRYHRLESQKPVFCKAGDLCVIDGVTFTAKMIDSGSLICAESYSLCPYNFSIGGGSEYCDYYQDGKWNNTSKRWDLITPADVEAENCRAKSEIRNADCSYNEKANKCRNYCQYLTHCTVTSTKDYKYTSELGSPYFSDACINFVGDSQNQTQYGGGFILNSQKHFSAPIAQCVRETMENLFYNVAGHSRCDSTNEYPSPDGVCPSGNYKHIGDFIYRKGNTVKETSFFTIVQNAMQLSVKMVLTLSIMFYGMNILVGKANVGDKKDIVMYLIKMALVLYFATGDAWQAMFFKGVYGASSEISRMVFKIDANASANKRDGCQFGTLSVTTKDSQGNILISEESSGRTYPAGKEYLALWDTLDCKIMRYLGYGPEASASNIASLILAGYFSFAGVGLYIAVAAMIFGFFFLALTLRALHIFLGSCMGIIILVFVSPIILPTLLFKVSADIFKKWLSELIGYCLQPVILFAFIAFFTIVVDRTLIGSATFSGQAPAKAISCSRYCLNSNGTIEPYVNGQFPPCADTGDKIVNPMNDSVACLVNLQDFGTMPGLEMFGLSIPILMNIFKDNAQVKVLTLLKGAIVMWLLYKFMDLITGIAARLVGGSELKSGDADPIAMMNKLNSVLGAIQKRTTGASNKMAKAAERKGGEMKDAIGKAGSQGKKDSGGGGGDGQDRTTSSSGGGEGTSGSNEGDSA